MVSIPAQLRSGAHAQSPIFLEDLGKKTKIDEALVPNGAISVPFTH